MQLKKYVFLNCCFKNLCLHLNFQFPTLAFQNGEKFSFFRLFLKPLILQFLSWHFLTHEICMIPKFPFTYSNTILQCSQRSQIYKVSIKPQTSIGNQLQLFSCFCLQSGLADHSDFCNSGLISFHRRIFSRVRRIEEQGKAEKLKLSTALRCRFGELMTLWTYWVFFVCQIILDFSCLDVSSREL